MVGLDVIREEMRKRLEQDKELHMVEVHADTIDEALQDASVQLDTKISNLQYEIVERGSDGFLGMGKKPWKLRIYQDPSTIKKVQKLASEGLFTEDGMDEEAHIEYPAKQRVAVRGFRERIRAERKNTSTSSPIRSAHMVPPWTICCTRVMSLIIHRDVMPVRASPAAIHIYTFLINVRSFTAWAVLE